MTGKFGSCPAQGLLNLKFSDFFENFGERAQAFKAKSRADPTPRAQVLLEAPKKNPPSES